MTRIRIQPAQYVDQIVDGHEMTKLPYPLVADEEGNVEHQELWRGDPAKVIGFQKDLAIQQVDLWWADVVADPKKAVGTYMITSDDQGGWGTHMTAVMSAEVLG